MPSVTRIAAGLLLGGYCSVLIAQETAAPVVVTATRTAQTADQSLAAVTVITRAEIARSQANSLSELLTGLSGLQVTSNGGYGKASDIFMRGTNSSHVLILLDGERLGSATLGTTAVQDIPLDQIQRIEIVRGPRSALYGSEAIGGVIQIFTRRDSGVHANLGVGSNSTYQEAAGIGGHAGATRYHLEASHFATAGFNAAVGSNPDRDGYRRTALSAHLAHDFNAANTVSLDLLRSEGNNDYDGYDPTVAYRDATVQQALNARWRSMVTDNWTSTLSLGESRDESLEYADAALTNTYRTRRQQASWQNDLQLGDALLLTLGTDYLNDRVISDTAYTKTQRYDRALFAQAQYSRGGHDWLLGVRGDDNQQFGRHNTGNIGWGHTLADGLRLTASFGTAFKAPTFNDLYYQDPYGSNGNPDLKPETSDSAEIGLQSGGRTAHWQLHAYRTNIHDLIQWVQISSLTWQPQNVSGARIDGVELEADGRFGPWSTRLTATTLDARDSSTGMLLPYRPRQSGRLDVGRAFGALRADLSWLLQGPCYADAANTQTLPGYGVVNLALNYRAAPHWRLGARVDNLFDQPYQQVLNYNTAGRTVFVNVSYRPR